MLKPKKVRKKDDIIVLKMDLFFFNISKTSFFLIIK